LHPVARVKAFGQTDSLTEEPKDTKFVLFKFIE
jgi:hypothetical protein